MNAAANEDVWLVNAVFKRDEVAGVPYGPYPRLEPTVPLVSLLIISR